MWLIRISCALNIVVLFIFSNSLISKFSFIYKIGIYSYNSDLSFTLFLNKRIDYFKLIYILNFYMMLNIFLFQYIL